jgi:hypothetical protein
MEIDLRIAGSPNVILSIPVALPIARLASSHQTPFGIFRDSRHNSDGDSEVWMEFTVRKITDAESNSKRLTDFRDVCIDHTPLSTGLSKA